MQNVQAPAANGWRVLLGQALRCGNQFFPQVGLGHQQARRQILLDRLPGRLRFRRGHTLLEYGQAQGVSQFNAMKAGELDRKGICPTPGIRLRRIGVCDV